MEILNINLIPGYYPCSTAHVSKNDNNRVIRLNLYDDCRPFILDGTEALILRVRKVDGSHAAVSVINTANKYVDIPITDDLTDTAGKLFCKLRINGIGTQSFHIEVEK